ncbi:MAG: LptE family protein [Cyclobacteriaceae bacterium]
MSWRTKIRICVIFLLIAGLSGCGIYSFTGASISSDIKTISIQTFYNNSPLGPSNMSAVFTEKIKDYYQQNTSLTLVDDEGDLQLEGAISNYTLSPVAPSSSQGSGQLDFTSLTRITITVNAAYVNTQDDQFDFDRSFSFFVDFDQTTTDLASNEDIFVDEIFDQIVLDIFNSSVANW